MFLTGAEEKILLACVELSGKRLGEVGLPMGDIQRRCGLDARNFHEAVDSLLDRGWLACTGDGRPGVDDACLLAGDGLVHAGTIAAQLERDRRGPGHARAGGEEEGQA